MKITRYLWINDLPKHCNEEEIKKTFQSHGKIQTIRIHCNHKSRGAIVAFIDCKSSTKAYENVKFWRDMSLKLEYCEANGEPGINRFGTSEYPKHKYSSVSGSSKSSESISRSSSSSSGSNTSSFGSSLDDCDKYPTSPYKKRLSGDKSADNDSDDSSNKKSRKSKSNTVIFPNTDAKTCLNTEYRGLLVDNLSQRSSDTSLREGLFHEFKKHGKITSVSVMGEGSGRYAIISFQRAEDMEKGFAVSQGKRFFGNELKIKKHYGYNYIDPDLCPPEHAMDEFHPKATKTLFVGKLTTGVIEDSVLKKIFHKFGEIIDVDIKIQSNQPDTSFAFVQYYDISSVVRALKHQETIKIDGQPVKLGFGKSQPCNCVWVGNLQRNNNDETFLRRHFKRFGPILLVIPDKEYHCALIQFEVVDHAVRAFTDTRERSNNTGNSATNTNNNTNNYSYRRMHIDYASNEYQMAFMNRLRKNCQFDSQDFLKNIEDPYQAEKLQNLLLSYTKYLGILDETRHRSYDRYDAKSEYEECDDYYRSCPSHRPRSVHKRSYNDHYGIDDEEYSDEYHHYAKARTRHYDEYSSSRSPVRYSRKYISERYQDGADTRPRSNYQHYYEYPHDQPHPSHQSSSSNYYYPYRRSPEMTYTHYSRNKSYSPSPPSSLDYNDDYHRYNLSPPRYSRSNRSRPTKCEPSPEPRNWSKQFRYDYSAIRSKSRSKSSKKRDPVKKSRAQRSPINKMSYSTLPKSKIEITKPVTIERTVSSVVQPVDALTKLERERAKLLAELSLLTEDSSNKTVKSVVKIADSDTMKSVNKVASEEKHVGLQSPPTVPDEGIIASLDPDPIKPDSDHISTSSQSRDPRLSATVQPVSPVISPTNEYVVIEPPVCDTINYKDSASDSDLDHFSTSDCDVEKRIRELDAKINRSEQSVRTLDYSKFTIRRKLNDGVTTSPSTMLSPSTCAVTTSSLFDVGYTAINRESSSSTSDFIKTMLNQTKSKSYHLLSDSVKAPCTMLPFRTVDLGANDIERRSLYSLSQDSALLNHTPRLPVVTVVPAVPSSPTTPLGALTTSITSTGADTNQTVKSILKKSNSITKIIDSPVTVKTEVQNQPTPKTTQKPMPTVDLKRKVKSEFEITDVRSVVKKTKYEYGPVLDDSLFRTNPIKPVKKVKKTINKPLIPEVPVLSTQGKRTTEIITTTNRIKRSAAKESVEKVDKTLKQKKKSDCDATLNKRTKATGTKINKAKAKKTQKVTKRKSDQEEDVNGDVDNESDLSDDSEQRVVSMYHKIKRRKVKGNCVNKRERKQDSDSFDSDKNDDEEWSVTSNKTPVYGTRKQTRLSGCKVIRNKAKVKVEPTEDSPRLKDLRNCTSNNDPVKKHLITDQNISSEEVLCMEKQAIDEYDPSSPTSDIVEPPSHLQSIYDSRPRTNVCEEEVVLDDHHHNSQESSSVTADDVNSASQILLTMKSQPTIEPEPDQQLQSVAEHLISLAHHSTIANIDIKKEDESVCHSINQEPLLLSKPDDTNTFNIPLSVIANSDQDRDHNSPIEAQLVKSDETASTSSTDKRTRHNSTKSDGPMNSLDETIDSVVRSSMSSSASDAVSIKSVTDIDINFDETKSVSKCCDMSSLDDIMNEVINKVSVTSSTAVATPHNQSLIIDSQKTKSKNVAVNQVKPQMYQLSNNVGGIANLVLNIPSIFTVNTVVNQQNPMNHILNFQSPICGQNKPSNQMSQCSSTSSSQVLPCISLTSSNTNSALHNRETLFTKLSSLTPIMIQTPLRNLAPNLTISSSNAIGPNLVSIATNSSCNFISSGSISTACATNSINSVNIPTTSLDPNYYFMLQQNNQFKSKIPNSCQSVSTGADLPSTGHSIILSQFSNSNSILSPITPGYLSLSINNKPNPQSTANPVTLQTLGTTNGVTSVCSNTAPSILFRPLKRYFPKFEEKDDWLKQNPRVEWNYPIKWTGKLCLKNDDVFVQMHMLAGNEDLISESMNLISPGDELSQSLKIVQRMRLETNQLEGLQRRLSQSQEFCTCLTLAGGDKTDELERISSTLNENFIKYLQDKSAAGIINISLPVSQQNAYVIHIFPSCEFSDNQLKSCCMNLYKTLQDNCVPYLVIVITRV